MRSFIFMLSVVVAFWACSKEDPAEDTTGTPGTTGNPVGYDTACFEFPSYTDQLPNMDFEDWGYSISSGRNFKDMCGGVWASGNSGSYLGQKLVLEPDENAHGGMYAARMESHQVVGNLAAGSVYTGKFLLNLSNPKKSAKLGVPFNAKPKTLDGYYKYTSVDNDSAQFIVYTTKFNATKGWSDTVGYGIKVEYNSVNDWTKFSIPVDYNYPMGAETPDTIVVSFTSSKGSTEEVFVGSVGSTLYIDDIEFTY